MGSRERRKKWVRFGYTFKPKNMVRRFQCYVRGRSNCRNTNTKDSEKKEIFIDRKEWWKKNMK